MFGFFKSKSKDKVADKDKTSDNSKDKKKEKGNKEDKGGKDLKDFLRKNKEDKNKEDKPSKSIFRKSRSIEKIKNVEEACEHSSAKRSKTAEGRRSDGWQDGGTRTTPTHHRPRSAPNQDIPPTSPTRDDDALLQQDKTFSPPPPDQGSHQEKSPQPDKTTSQPSASPQTKTDSSVTSTHHHSLGSSASEDRIGGQSSSISASLPQVNPTAVSRSFDSSTRPKFDIATGGKKLDTVPRVTLGNHTSNRYGTYKSGAITSTFDVDGKGSTTEKNTFSENLKLLSDKRLTVPTTSSKASHWRQSEGPQPLMMKPPLIPRPVGPRGPLAAAPSSTSGTTVVLAGPQVPELVPPEKDERCGSPTTGVCTPPSSPGMPSGQAVPPYPSVTSPPSRPTSPDGRDGRASMLSTPSSSTSSLSSLSARPISPSGRRTPPGPRMGTGTRLSSSPTASRKTVRTNIKTNPTVASRRAGSRSPLTPSPPPTSVSSSLLAEGSEVNTPPASPRTSQTCPQTPPASPHTTRRPIVQDNTATHTRQHSQHVPQDWTPRPVSVAAPVAMTSTTSISSSSTSLPVMPSVKPKTTSSPSLPLKSSVSNDSKAETVKLTTRSASPPTAGKSRHSISSMHSLESIPENESDGQISTNNTLERNNKKDVLKCKQIKSLPLQKDISGQDANTAHCTSTERQLAPADVTTKGLQPHSVVSHRSSVPLTPVSEEKPSEGREGALLPELTSDNLALFKEEFKTYTASQKGAIAKLAKHTSPSPSHKGTSLSSERKEEVINKKRGMGANEDGSGVCDARKEKVSTDAPQKPSSNAPHANVVQNKSISVNEPIPDSAAALDDPISIILKGTVKKLEEVEEKKSKDFVVPVGCTEGLKDKNSELKSETVHDGRDNNEATTHAVFRIPLRRSETDINEVERRVSVEILSGESGVDRASARESRKDRPRSLSTSRDVAKENKNCDPRSRKRAASASVVRFTDTQDDKKWNATNSEHRSSSSCQSESLGINHNADSRSDITTFAADKGKNDEDTEESEVVVPWRRPARSRSRGAERRRPHRTINEDQVTQRSENVDYARSVDKTRSDLTDHHRTRSTNKGNRREVNPEVSSISLLPNGIDTDPPEVGRVDQASGEQQISAPPRRSRSRGADWRMTRSVTLNEIRRDRGATTAASDAIEKKEDRPRALSTSRAKDATSSEHQPNAPTDSKPLRRRRSLSTTRSQTRNEEQKDPTTEVDGNLHLVLSSDKDGTGSENRCDSLQVRPKVKLAKNVCRKMGNQEVNLFTKENSNKEKNSYDSNCIDKSGNDSKVEKICDNLPCRQQTGSLSEAHNSKENGNEEASSKRNIKRDGEEIKSEIDGAGEGEKEKDRETDPYDALLDSALELK